MPVLCLWKPPSSPPDRTFQLQWTTCIGNARSSSTSLVRFHAKEMEKNLSVKMDKLETRPSGDGDEGGKRHDCEGNEECRGSVVKKLRALPLRPQPPTCQAEKCNADLTSAKDYHRRHKVCEVHFKAPSVLVGGLEQRFCQQCSRFHVLAEFDEAKRSCRRRLAGHNERRRKISSDSSADRLDASRRLNESWCRHMEEAGRMAIVLERNPTVNVCKEIKNHGIAQLMFGKR